MDKSSIEIEPVRVTRRTSPRKQYSEYPDRAIGVYLHILAYSP